MQVLFKYLAAEEECGARRNTVPSGRGGRSELCSYFLKTGLSPTYDPPPGTAHTFLHILHRQLETV